MCFYEIMLKLLICYIRCFWNEEVFVYCKDVKFYLVYCKISYCIIYEKLYIVILIR